MYILLDVQYNCQIWADFSINSYTKMVYFYKRRRKFHKFFQHLVTGTTPRFLGKFKVLNSINHTIFKAFYNIVNNEIL
jgi:hypothetical protein